MDKDCTIKYGFNGKECPDAWVEAHEYDWIYNEKADILYWCTGYQCAEEKLHQPSMQLKWHSTAFFDSLLRAIICSGNKIE